jgi:hypothetical protein
MRAIIHTLFATSLAWALGALVLVGCAAVQHAPSHPYTGRLPPNTNVDLGGTFTLSPAGELVLALGEPCTVGHTVHGLSGGGGGSSVPCDRAHLDAIQVAATTPWRREVRGAWVDPGHITFHVDWKNSGLDPLADDAASVAARPWLISGAVSSWTPSAAEASQMLKLIGDATETELEIVRGGAAPSLEVSTFEVADGSLRSGGEATLVVKVANRGTGTAYRVVASTRSSVASLHGQRLPFGMIKPGGEKIRRIQLTVPVSETAPDTMLVLVVAEGNGFAPRNVSKRVPITVSSSAPVLTVRCTIPGHAGARPDLDAGDTVALHCLVDNTGTSAAKVELETSIAGAAPARSSTQDIAAAGHAAFDVAVAIPRELAIDSAVEIAVSAHDRKAGRSARTAVVGVVRKLKLCTSGQLTRAQYRAKLTELRAAVAAGDLTQAQLDRYDAELVTCLK